MERIEARLAPHARAISMIAAICFWAGIAIQARFVPRPELPRPLEAMIGLDLRQALIPFSLWKFTLP